MSPGESGVHEKREHVRLHQIEIFGLNQEPLRRPSPVFGGFLPPFPLNSSQVEIILKIY